MNYLAEQLSLRLVTYNIIATDKRKFYTYGIELLLHDLLIFLMLGVAAVLTHTVFISLIFTISFCVLRSYTGGYHSGTYSGCFFTAVVNYAGFLLFHFFLRDWRFFSGSIMMVIFIPVILKYSPVEHRNNPLTKVEIKKYKKIARILVCIYSTFFIAALRFISIDMAFAASWSISATAVLMLIPIIQNRNGGEKNEETVFDSSGSHGRKSDKTG